MSRFVDDGWSLYQPADAPRPPATTWSTWVRREHLRDAPEEERLDRWIEWNETNVPTPQLLESIERSGRHSWIEAIHAVVPSEQRAQMETPSCNS